MLILMPQRPCTIWALCSSRVAASPGTTNRCGLNLLRADAGCGFAREKEFALRGSTRTFTHSSSRTLRVYTKCLRRRICTFPFCRSVRLSSGSRVELNMGEQTAAGQLLVRNATIKNTAQAGLQVCLDFYLQLTLSQFEPLPLLIRSQLRWACWSC